MRAFAAAALCVLIALAAAAAAVSAYSESDAMFGLDFAKIAYCNSGDIRPWSCGACGLQPQFKLTRVYHNPAMMSQALSGYEPNTNRIVVAFRGTDNFENWITDLTFDKVAYTNQACSGCYVHSGFLAEWHGISTAVLADVNQLVQQYPSAQIFVTGHSLGAAVALLASLSIVSEIALPSGSLAVYTMGEPRVGEANFVAWAVQTLPAGQQYRVTHMADPVPHVPPMNFNYLHVPQEIWYNNNGASAGVRCQGTAQAEDPACSDSVPVYDYTIDDHLFYLGRWISHCTLDSPHLPPPRMAVQPSQRDGTDRSGKVKKMPQSLLHKPRK